MKLFEEVETQEAGTLETFGTVAENIGKNGIIEFDENNLKREDKLVMVDLTNSNGKKQRVMCSAPLSAKIRKDKMKKQDLINYVGSLDIALTTNAEEEQRFKIVLRQGAKISGKVTAAAAPVATTLDEITW